MSPVPAGLRRLLGACAAWALLCAPASGQQSSREPGSCLAGFETEARLDRTLDIDEFRIRYAAQGTDAEDLNGNGVPDVIDDLAIQLVAARSLYTDVLNLTHPLQQPRYRLARKIDVFVIALERVNGLAFDEVSFERRAGGGKASDCALSIHISERVQPRRNATPAHELFHLYQYGYAMFKSGWYLEGLTRWMEAPFFGQRAIDRDALKGNYARCEDVLARGPGSSPFWRSLARSRGPEGDVALPGWLRAMRYVDGRPVFAADIFEGGRLPKVVLTQLEKSSAAASERSGLPMYKWPERLQQSSEFDADICAAVLAATRM